VVGVHDLHAWQIIAGLPIDSALWPFDLTLSHGRNLG
jgi:hypothetical protein